MEKGAPLGGRERREEEGWECREQKLKKERKNYKRGRGMGERTMVAGKRQ